MRKSEIKSSFGLLTSALIWGVSYVLNKFLVSSLPPILMLWCKYAVAAVVVLALFHKRLKQINKKTLFSGALLGSLLCIAHWGQVTANLYTSAGKVAFITTMYVIWVPIFLWIAERKRPEGRTAVGAILAITGLMLLSVSGDLGINFGDAIVVVSSMIHAVHIITTGVKVRESEPILLAVVQYLTAFVISTVIALTMRADFSQLAMIQPKSVLMLLYQGVFGIVAAFTLQTVHLRHVRPDVAPVLLATQSVFAMVLSLIVGYDQLTLRVFSGCALMFGAILLLELRPRKRLLQKAAAE